MVLSEKVPFKTKGQLFPLLIVTLIYLSILVMYRNGSFETIELYAYDKLIQRYSATSNAPSVTVIKITETDINQLKNYPVSDKILAEVLEQLEHYQAGVIGFDIFRNIPVQPGHKKLETVLSQYQNIIAPFKYGENKSTEILPPQVLRNTGQFGFTDGLIDRDNIVRRGLISLHKDQHTPYYSLALHMTLLYLQQKNISIQTNANNHLQIGTSSITPLKSNDGAYVNEDAQGYQFLLDFCKPPESIPQYTLAQFRSGKIKPEDFKDKMLLIGVDAESVKDHFYMPCSEQETGRNKLISGVMLHAAIIDQLVRVAEQGRAPMKTATDWQEMLWVLFWTFMGWLISLRQHSFKQLISAWLIGLLVLMGVTALLFSQGIWLIVATPLLALFLSSLLITAYSAIQEKQHRTQLMGLFSKHVAPEIAEELWHKREQFFVEGRPRPQQSTATVMFTDLQNFTQIAEGLEPGIFFDWLNEYLAAMTPLVAKHGGVVIRFIGDAIFAGFGIPVSRQSEIEICQDAINAVKCALAMNDKLIQLNKNWRRQNKPIVAMRIGLFTGPLATGSIGAEDRMEYTIHGDTVNTAARLEAFEKEHFIPDHFRQPCRIFMGGKMVDYLADQFQLEAIGNVELRGKKQRVDVYQVIDKIKKPEDF